MMNRFRSITLFFLALASLGATVSGVEKPNIIVIFTDDQGYSDLGVQGVTADIKTPNIDKLAAAGVRMTAGYVTAPQCIPSRAGLLSGHYQQRFGVDHNGTYPMPLDEVLLPQRLREAGYVTGMTGKWHLEPNHVQLPWIRENMNGLNHKKKIVPQDIPLSAKMPYFPSARGFDEYFYGQLNRFWCNYDLDGNRIEPQWLDDKRYRLDVQTDAAVTFIERNHGRPFFFYLPYFAPHVPLEATDKYLRRFPGEMPERRRYCLAMMSAIDDGVGKILKTIRKHRIEKNTLIFFISDNGAPLKIHKEDLPISFKGGAWDGSLNDPWVGEKGMISEGGIRVPFIMSWPARISGGTVYDRPVISLDVAATSVAVAGLDTSEELDGANLIPYLTGEKTGQPHEALYWRFWEQSAIRMGDWKYLKAGKREYLFDLGSKEHERANLINRYPDKVGILKKKLESWASELKTPGLPNGDLRREGEWYDTYFKDQD